MGTPQGGYKEEERELQQLAMLASQMLGTSHLIQWWKKGITKG